MISHYAAAESYLDLVECNEENTTDPAVLLGMAHVHALLALTEAIKGINSDTNKLKLN